MMVCEFLNCTRSELNKRLRKGKGYVDYFLILAYLEKKSEIEAEQAEEAKHKR